MNRKFGMYSAILTFLSVLGFAGSMVIGSGMGSYFTSLFISWGAIPLVCSFAAFTKKEDKAAAYTAMAFASLYGVFIAIVYFAQMTTLQTNLTDQASILLDYKRFSLFFNYDLLGYGFMALAFFFVALTLEVRDRGDKWLKILMLVHGVFWITGILLPVLGVFKADMAGGDLAGILVLEFWCIYFMPVCLLSYRYFKKMGTT